MTQTTEIPEVPNGVLVTVMLGRYKRGKGFETVQAQGRNPQDVIGALNNAIAKWEECYGRE